MRIATLLVIGSVSALGCGEDKGYGDPIENPAAQMAASQMATSITQATTAEGNDGAVLALTGAMNSANLLLGAKLQAQYEQPQVAGPRANLVDEACVVVSEGTITYDNCEFQGGSMNGSVTVSPGRVVADVSIDVSLPEEDIETSNTLRADLSVSDTAIQGFIDFSTQTSTSEVSVSATFSSDFDLVLEGGCAVGGEIETHADVNARGQGQSASQSVWVKAEFGPTCGEVVIR